MAIRLSLSTWIPTLQQSRLMWISKHQWVNTQGILPTYGFTILSELITALVILVISKRKNTVSIKPLVWTVVWANILSYPIAWITIPSLGRFETESFRSVGMILFFVVILLTMAGFWFSRNKPSKGIIIASIFVVPICVVITLVGVVLLTYGNYNISLSGLSPIAVIFAAEVFAFAFEAFLLYRLPKSKLPLLFAILLSLATNTVSAILGYFLWW